MDELLRAIIEHPDDEGARLVYADALLQAGDRRGELIVRQCRGDAAPELVKELTLAWEAALGPDVRVDRFDRGFPSVIDLYLSEEHGLAALDRAPITYVKLHHSRWDLHDEANETDDFDFSTLEPDPAVIAVVFATDPRAARIPTLDLSHTGWGDTALAILLATPMPALRRLYISDPDCASEAAVEVARAIATNPSLALRDLALCGDSYGSASEFLRVLCATPRARSLRSLSLDNCGLSDTDIAVLAASPHLAELEDLHLTGGSNTTNEIGDDGMIAIVRSPHLQRLKRLSLGNNHVTDHGLLALADPAVLPHLESLALNSSPITAAALERVVAVHAFDSLFLGGCPQLGDAGLIAIARSPHVARLRGLNVFGTHCGAAGIAALIAAPIDKLEYLGIKAVPELEQLLIERFGAAAVA